MKVWYVTTTRMWDPVMLDTLRAGIKPYQSDVALAINCIFDADLHDEGAVFDTRRACMEWVRDVGSAYGDCAIGKAEITKSVLVPLLSTLAAGVPLPHVGVLWLELAPTGLKT